MAKIMRCDPIFQSNIFFFERRMFCYIRLRDGQDFANSRNDANVCVIATSPASGVVTYARTFSRHDIS
jgi:hypothetical protein